MFKDGEIDGPGIVNFSGELLLTVKRIFRGSVFQPPQQWEVVGPGHLITSYKTRTYSYIGEIQALGTHGYGVQLYNESAKYEGQFTDNLQNGFGIVYDRDGNRCEGRWESGEMIGEGTGMNSKGEQMACAVDNKLKISFTAE